VTTRVRRPAKVEGVWLSATTIGRRVLLLDPVLSRSTRAQKDLARRLKLKEPRVSKGIKSLKRNLRVLTSDVEGLSKKERSQG